MSFQDKPIWLQPNKLQLDDIVSRNGTTVINILQSENIWHIDLSDGSYLRLRWDFELPYYGNHRKASA